MKYDFRHLHRAEIVFVSLLATVTVALVAAAAILGVYTAIKGAYIPIGIALAMGLYYRTQLESSSELREDTARYQEAVYRFGPRLVGLACVWAVGVAVITGDRALGLLIGLPVGFGILALQAIIGVSVPTLLIEAVALYGTSSFSKYLTNDFYFGGSDTLYHVYSVDTLVQTGSVAELSRYSFFPGFAIVNGAIRMLGRISAYDAILLTGIITFGAVMLSAFLLVYAATNEKRLGVFAAVGLVMVEPFLYYATYFFPQSLAVALVVFGLYIAYRANQERKTRLQFSFIGLALIAALVVTHQLTIILFIPIVLLLFVITYLLRRIDTHVFKSDSQLPLPRGYLAVVAVFTAVSYWAYRSPFFQELASSIQTIARFSLFTGDFGSPTPIYALGTKLPALTFETAFWGLFSTDGIYQMALLTVFLLGVATIIDRTRAYWPVLPLFSVGIAGAVVMFRTPFTLPGLDRLQLPLTVFFAVVVSLGLYRLTRSPLRSKTTLFATIALIAIVGTAAPLNYAAGDDLYRLNAGPNLYELYPTPQPQKAYSDTEYRDLESAAGFIRRHNATLYTFGTDSQAMSGFGVESQGATVNQSGIVTGKGLFLYRDRFINHRIPYAVSGGRTLQSGTVVIAPHWLNTTLATQNIVYASGQVGLLWNSNGSLINPDVEPTRTGDSGSPNQSTPH